MNFGNMSRGVSVCFGPSVSEQTACRTLITFVVRVLHKIFPNSYKFCASQHGVKYSLSAHPTLAVRFGQTSPKDRRIILLNICELPEIGGAKAIISLWP